MKRKDRSINLEEAIPGIIGTLLATLFLGFMAVDIGSIPLFLIVVIVLVMMIVDFVQTVQGGDDNLQ